MNEQDTSNTLKVLVAADELLLNELVDYLQTYLIENKADWIKQNFGFTYQMSFKHNSFSELQEFCSNLISYARKNP